MRRFLPLLLVIELTLKSEFTSALKLLRPSHDQWRPKVLAASSITKRGFEDIWETMNEYKKIMTENGDLERRRGEQRVQWLWMHLQEGIISRLKRQVKIKDIEHKVFTGELTPGEAVDSLLNKMYPATK